MGEISPIEIGPQSIGLKFRENPQFYKEIKRIINDFTLGYVCRKYFGIFPTSGKSVREILSGKIISLEKVLRFYERLREEKPSISISIGLMRLKNASDFIQRRNLIKSQ